MTLSDFERKIDSTILERGRGYWKAGLVSNIRGDDESVTADVKGSSLYQVEIFFEGSKIDDVFCDCPYDWEDCCKHVAAVLLALKNDGFPASNRDLLRDLLQTMSADDMRSLLEEILSKEPLWQERVLARGATEMEEVFSRYDTLLKEQIQAYSDGYGFIGYHQAADVGRIGSDALSDVEILIEDHEFEQALAISKAVLVNMNEAIADADDSNGFIGGAVQDTIDCLQRIAEAPDVPPGIADDLFTALTDKGFLDQFTDFDWHYALMEVAGDMADTEEREKRLFTVARTIVDETSRGSVSSYGNEWYQQLRLAHLRKFSSASEAESFIDNNVDIPSFRRMKLEALNESGKYNEVIRLAQDGAQKDRELPGLLCDWREWLLKGAEGTQDMDLQRAVLRQLYSDSYNITYYKALKSKYSESHWIGIRNTIHESIVGYWGHKAEVFIEEKMFDELWSLVYQNRTFDVLTNYDKYLLPKYTEEIRDLYSRLIPKSLERIKDRKHYRRIAEMIFNRQKSLGSGYCNELVLQLIKFYPNRPAMRDEFRQAGLL